MIDKIILTQRSKIQLSEQQKHEIEKCFGVTRFIFNKLLEFSKIKYSKLDFSNKEDRKLVNFYEIKNDFIKRLRKEYSHIIKSVPSLIINPSTERFIQALEKAVYKNGELKFRSKLNSNKMSCTFERKDYTSFYMLNKNTLRLCKNKIGDIKLLDDFRFNIDWKDANNKIKRISILKRNDDYYIYIVYELEKSMINSFPKTNKSIAFDWGVKTYLTGYDSDGNIVRYDFDNKILEKYNKNIKSKHKKLSNKKMGSNQYINCRIKLNKLYLQKSNYIKDFINKLVNDLCKKYDCIILEDLNIKKGIKKISNKNMNNKILDRPYYLFKKRAYEKFLQSNKDIYIIPKTFPSSKMCSKCQSILSNLSLNDRTYICNKCGYEEDRDINAAKNIYNCKDKIKYKNC